MKTARFFIHLTALTMIAAGLCRLAPILWEDRRAYAEYGEAAGLFTAPWEGTDGEGDSGARAQGSAFLPETGETAGQPAGAEDDRRLRITPPEDAVPPITVDWAALKAVNEDIVGWLYMDGDPAISYPVLQGETNETYLHTTYRGSYLYAGSIFLNATSSPDFGDPASYVFGHNMRSGSMFGRLKYLMNQESFKAHPCFWILTPAGDYRYRIFAAIQTTDGSAAYTVWKAPGPEFTKWANGLLDRSLIETGAKILEDDLVVGLSTCQGSGTQYRNMLFGVLISSARPRRHERRGSGTYCGMDRTATEP